jgi:hypothetical protein
MSHRFEIVSKAGVSLSILVERYGVGMTFPYVAVLGDWDEGVQHYFGKTPSQAVESLLELLGEEAPADLRFIDVYFGESLPSLMLRQAC